MSKMQWIEDGLQLIDNSGNMWQTAERFQTEDYKMVQDAETGDWYEGVVFEDYYVLRAGDEGMPAHYTEKFDTLDELRAAMGDLRHWVINQQVF